MIAPEGMREELEKIAGTEVQPILSRAPGRIEVLGNHTDYNAGLVLAATIDKYVWTLGVPSTDVHLIAMDLDDEIVFDRSALQPNLQRSWGDYAKGIFWAFERRNHDVTGVTAIIHGDVPRGGGLSSSAAFEVALVNLILKLSRIEIHPKAAAMIAFEAERLYCGVSCGIMDQFTSQMGQPDSLFSINCRNFMTSNVTLPSGASFVVVDSMVSRAADNALGVRRQECVQAVKDLQEAGWTIQNLSDIQPTHLEKAKEILDEVLMNRVIHVVEENDRVRRGIEAMKENDLRTFGQIMIASHRSSQNLYNVSHPNLDFLVDAAIKQEGVFGARLTGAGFGGAILALVRDDCIPQFMKSIAAAYESEMGTEPDVMSISIPGGVRVKEI